MAIMSQCKKSGCP